jgi:hypothetical protein
MIGYYFIVLAAIGVISGVIFLISRGKLRKNGVVKKGIVEKIQKRVWRQSGSGGHANQLVISYSDRNGNRKTFTEQNSIPAFFYKEGDEIELLLDSENYDRVMVKSNLVLFAAPIMIIALSIFAGYLGFRSL